MGHGQTTSRRVLAPTKQAHARRWRGRRLERDAALRMAVLARLPTTASGGTPTTWTSPSTLNAFFIAREPLPCAHCPTMPLPASAPANTLPKVASGTPRSALRSSRTTTDFLSLRVVETGGGSAVGRRPTLLTGTAAAAAKHATRRERCRTLTDDTTPPRIRPRVTSEREQPER